MMSVRNVKIYMILNFAIIILLNNASATALRRSVFVEGVCLSEIGYFSVRKVSIERNLNQNSYSKKSGSMFTFNGGGQQNTQEVKCLIDNHNLRALLGTTKNQRGEFEVTKMEIYYDKELLAKGSDLKSFYSASDDYFFLEMFDGGRGFSGMVILRNCGSRFPNKICASVHDLHLFGPSGYVQLKYQWDTEIPLPITIEKIFSYTKPLRTISVTG